MSTEIRKVTMHLTEVIASMPVRRYPRQLFNQDYKVAPHRGRQRKPWKKYVGELFEALGLHEKEMLDDIKRGNVHQAFFVKCE